MPAVKSQVSCPNCRQPVAVEIEQLFDVGEDPQAKQRLVSGGSNIVNCPHCGFNGQYPTVLVYHDPSKELLLTYVPPEMGLSLDQQERVVGPLITKAVNNLPQEKRKGYLLQPKTMLTSQTLMETIMEADGITKEMLEAQQSRLSLLQRLLSITSDDVFESVVKEEEKIIDRDTFLILSSLIQNAAGSGDPNLGNALGALQERLLSLSTYGQELKQQSEEYEAAISELQSLGSKLTRENLLDLVIKSSNDVRLKAYVGLARSGMDYQFFQLITERVDRARGDGRKRLANLREKLLALTSEYDQQLQARSEQFREVIDTLVKEDNTREAMRANINVVDELFLQVLQGEIEAAKGKRDMGRSAKLKQILEVIQEASSPPQEFEFINELIKTPDSETRQKMLEASREKITPELIEALTGVMAQMGTEGEGEGGELVNEIYKQVVRFSMMNQMKG